MKKLVAILIVAILAASMTSVALAEEAPLYIPLIAKGFQHQYWQAVAAGAQDAAEENNVEIYFDGRLRKRRLMRRSTWSSRNWRKIR